MAREARIVVPGVAHHVVQRGNYQQDIFYADGDRDVYLKYLRESGERYGLSVSAYCLMTNHVHLLVTPGKENSLAKALGRAHLMYAQYVNQSQEKIGHLWQGRFYSCPVDERAAYNVALYIESNPVRAKMVRVPWGYRWSSAAVHCGVGDDESGLLHSADWFEGCSPGEWKGALKAGIGSEMAEELQGNMRTGRPLGSSEFLESLEKRMGRDLQVRRRGRPKGSKDSYKRNK